MRAIGRILSTVVVTLALAKGASAATMYSPPLWTDPNHPINCTAVNTGSTPIATFVANVVDQNSNATVVATNSYAPLAPGEVARISFITAPSPGHYYYCQFQFAGSKTKVRAEIELDAPFPMIPTESLPLVTLPAY